MSIIVLQQVPRWVWVLLIALIAIGVSQSFPRRRTLRSATILPIAFIALSFYGVTSAFPFQPIALAAWAVGVCTAVATSLAIGAWSNIRWSAVDQRLIVPGSWVPLILFLSIFAVKFGVGMTLAMHPELARDVTFAALVGIAYGAFSGVFFARGLMMWKVAREALNISFAN